MELLGYSWDPSAHRAGEPASLTLFWKTDAPLAVNYSSFVHVLDASGHGVVGADNVHVADYPTSWWRVGAYARDVHPVTLPSNLASGQYRVEVGVYDRQSGKQLPIDGQPTDTLSLPPLTVGSGS